MAHIAVLCLASEGEEGVLQLAESLRSFLECGAKGLIVADTSPKPRGVIWAVVDAARERHDLSYAQVLHMPATPRDVVMNALSDAASAAKFTQAILARSHDLLRQVSNSQLVEALPCNVQLLDVLQVYSDSALRPRVDVLIRLSLFRFVGALDPVPLLHQDCSLWYMDAMRVRAAPWLNVSIATQPYMCTAARAMVVVQHTRASLAKWQRIEDSSDKLTPYEVMYGYQIKMQAATASLFAGLTAEAQRIYGSVRSYNLEPELYFAARLGLCRAQLRQAAQDSEAVDSLSVFADTAELGLKLGEADGVLMLFRALVSRDLPRVATLQLPAMVSFGPQLSGFMTDPSLWTYKLRAYMCLTPNGADSTVQDLARGVLQYGPMLINDSVSTTAVQHKFGALLAKDMPATMAAHFAPAMTLCQPLTVFHPDFVTKPAALFEKLCTAATRMAPDVNVWSVPGWHALCSAFAHAVMPLRGAEFGKDLQVDNVSHRVDGLLLVMQGVDGATVSVPAGYLVLLFGAECAVEVHGVGVMTCAAGSLLGVHESAKCTLRTDVPVCMAQLVPIL